MSVRHAPSALSRLSPTTVRGNGCWTRCEKAELEAVYRRMLETLANHPGTLGVIFRKAQNKIQDPAKLKKLIVELIDAENWSATGVDVKGDAYLRAYLRRVLRT